MPRYQGYIVIEVRNFTISEYLNLEYYVLLEILATGGLGLFILVAKNLTFLYVHEELQYVLV